MGKARGVEDEENESDGEISSRRKGVGSPIESINRGAIFPERALFRVIHRRTKMSNPHHDSIGFVIANRETGGGIKIAADAR